MKRPAAAMNARGEHDESKRPSPLGPTERWLYPHCPAKDATGVAAQGGTATAGVSATEHDGSKRPSPPGATEHCLDSRSPAEVATGAAEHGGNFIQLHVGSVASDDLGISWIRRDAMFEKLFQDIEEQFWGEFHILKTLLCFARLELV